MIILSFILCFTSVATAQIDSATEDNFKRGQLQFAKALNPGQQTAALRRVVEGSLDYGMPHIEAIQWALTKNYDVRATKVLDSRGQCSVRRAYALKKLGVTLDTQMVDPASTVEQIFKRRGTQPGASPTDLRDCERARDIMNASQEELQDPEEVRKLVGPFEMDAKYVRGWSSFAPRRDTASVEDEN